VALLILLADGQRSVHLNLLILIENLLILLWGYTDFIDLVEEYTDFIDLVDEFDSEFSVQMPGFSMQEIAWLCESAVVLWVAVK